jgi:hypothetical protein
MTFRVEHRLKAGRLPVASAAGDFNGDGAQDLVVANSGSNNISIYRGDGKGGFSDAVSLGVGKSPRALAVGDLNSDGRSDIAVANYDSDNVTVLWGAAAATSQLQSRCRSASNLSL